MQNLKDMFQQALLSEKTSMTAFAAKHYVDPSHFSKWRKGTINLTPQLKAAIFRGWQSEATQIALFNAHLKDEIEAAGLTGKVKAACYNDRDYDLDDN